MADIIYLTGERVQQLHILALEEAGGLEGVRSMHAVYSSLAQAEQAFGNEDVFATVAEKAAAYAYYLTMNHPFNDGNKRTAALAMEVFLDLNGYEFAQTDEEMESMFVDLAAGTIDQGNFFGWVMNHVHPCAHVRPAAE